MKEKRSILLDVDAVICFPGFLDAINDFMKTNYEIDDFKDYYIDEAAIPKDKFDEFNKFMSERNLYQNAHMLPNAIRVIEKLNYYYEIYICSSCINPFDIERSGKLFKDKYDFLIKKLPFINPNNFIFTNTKNLFNADVQIDDNLVNLRNNIKLKILFPSYHNKEIEDEELKKSGIIRAGYDWRTGWKEVENILITKQKIYKK